jgi:endonuclease/exonuclease/phosphatase family metal-dependent hydrolase
MKRLFGLALAGLLFIGSFSAPAVADNHVIKVWTQNLYLGADLTPLLLAEDFDELEIAATSVIEQIAANFFPLRAQRLATEVALSQPDVICLQEVFDFKLNDLNDGLPFIDYLQAIRNALAVRGQYYQVAATVVNLDLDIDLTFDITGEGIPDSVHVLDRDVILVREGVENVTATDFTGLCFKRSEEGCNYFNVAQFPSLLGLITIERGFVGVDVTVRGKDYRVVNTHLEQRELFSGIPAPYQSQQAAELVATLTGLSSDNRTLILTGDFNSSPADPTGGLFDPPYEIISNAGFADIWDTNPLALFDPNGFTCCQDPDLANRMSHLDERIDIIFVFDSSFLPRAFVTSQVPIFPLWLPPNWASDHGGVFGKLIFW